MTTFISWETSSGKKGRCDARCHNAKGSKCKCACGGLMHGANNGKTEVEFQEYTQKIQHFVFAELRKHLASGEITRLNISEQQYRLFF